MMQSITNIKIWMRVIHLSASRWPRMNLTEPWQLDNLTEIETDKPFETDKPYETDKP